MKTFAPLFLLTGVKYYLFAPTHLTLAKKKVSKRFGDIKKKPYFCSSYPENNLFTLRKTNTY